MYLRATGEQPARDEEDRQQQLAEQAAARRQLGSAGVLLPVGLAFTATAALLANPSEANAAATKLDSSSPPAPTVTRTADTDPFSRDLSEGLERPGGKRVTLTPPTPDANGPGSPRTRPPSAKR